jgi:hypothetical protein
MRHIYQHGNGGPWVVTFRASIYDLKSTKKMDFHVWRAYIYVGAPPIEIVYVHVVLVLGHGDMGIHFIGRTPITMPTILSHSLGRLYMWPQVWRREWAFPCLVGLLVCLFVLSSPLVVEDRWRIEGPLSVLLLAQEKEGRPWNMGWELGTRTRASMVEIRGSGEWFSYFRGISY